MLTLPSINLDIAPTARNAALGAIMGLGLLFAPSLAAQSTADGAQLWDDVYVQCDEPVASPIEDRWMVGPEWPTSRTHAEIFGPCFSPKAALVPFSTAGDSVLNDSLLMKPPVLVLAGHSGSSLEVSRIARKVSEARPDLQVYIVSYDTRNGGHLRVAKDIVAQLQPIIEATKDQPVPLTLVGNSMGATIAHVVSRRLDNPRWPKKPDADVSTVDAFSEVKVIGVDPVMDGAPAFGTDIPVLGQGLSGLALGAAQRSALDMRVNSRIYRNLFRRAGINANTENVYAGAVLHDQTANPFFHLANFSIRRITDFRTRELADLADAVMANPRFTKQSPADNASNLDVRNQPSGRRARSFFSYLFFADAHFDSLRTNLSEELSAIPSDGSMNKKQARKARANAFLNAFHATYRVLGDEEHLGMPFADGTVDAVLDFLPAAKVQ